MSTDAGILESSTKRKRSSLDPKISKRVCSKISQCSDEDGQAQILLLESEILESKKNYNNLDTLIKIFESNGDHDENIILAGVSLCRVFTRLIVSGRIIKRQDDTDKEAVVKRWLKDKYLKYKKNLVNLLRKDPLAPTILTLCMRLLKTEGEYFRVGQDYEFPTLFLMDIVHVLLSAESDEKLIEDFGQKFVEEYDDIRFYTLEVIEKLINTESAKKSSKPKIFENCLKLLATVESIPNSAEELEDFYIPKPEKKKHALYSLTQHKKRAQAAWLALMRLEMNKSQRKSILKLMTDSIAPWFIKPEILMDFLTDSYNTGGSISLLALSGVFYLIQERNLDYPLFYHKLYSLLDAEILHSKHRTKFIRLLDIFLGSTHLPAALVASFIKRLSRLALNAPPPGIVAVVPWIYNLLKKHPYCTFMIHRETRDVELKKMIESEGFTDPFLPNMDDPMESKAIESCLWEIVMLQSHYHPNVATLAKIISEQFTKNSYNIEDFLDHSYGSMLEAEISKEVKKPPVVEFKIPKNIFTEPDPNSDTDNNLLTRLWDFS